MSAEWFQVYEARFGKKLSEAEINVWEDEIALQIRRLMPGDVISAVRSVAETRRKVGQRGAKFAPTVEDIITEIIKGKYARANPGAVEAGHTVLVQDIEFGDGHWNHEVEPERSWKSRLHAASSDAVEAWNIICEPTMPEQCKERKEYAEGHGIAYERIKPQLDKHVIPVASGFNGLQRHTRLV
jgi:hypothetical protein